MSKVTDIANEIIDSIADLSREVEFEDRIMLLLYISESCKTQVDVILAHEYHSAFYGRRDGDE